MTVAWKRRKTMALLRNENMALLTDENKRLHDELAVLEAKAKEDFERARISEKLAHDCSCDLIAEVKRLREKVDWIVAVLKIGPAP
jgi:hypothetical protein